MNMRQALHIFRKDLRNLRWDVAIIVALMALFAYIDSGWIPVSINPVHTQLDFLLRLLLPVSWFYLIARVIHAESLVGDRQFWLTRPYSRTSLLLAKMLFVFAVIVIPKTIVDAIIVHARGLALPLSGWFGFEILLVVTLLLPIAMLSVVTPGIVQVALAAFAVVAGLIGFSSLDIGEYWYASAWLQDLLRSIPAAAIAAFVVAMQYRHRRTLLAQIIAGCAALTFLIPLPWKLGAAIEERLSKTHDSDSIRISLDPSRQARVARIPNRFEAILIPLRVDGLPGSSELDDDRIRVQVSGAASLSATPASELFHDSSGYWLAIKAANHPKSQSIHVKASMFLTLFGDAASTTIPVSMGFIDVPGAGKCAVYISAAGAGFFYYQPMCAVAFRWEPNRVSTRIGDATYRFMTTDYSPLPAEMGISPVQAFVSMQLGSIFSTKTKEKLATFTAAVPLAHFHRDLEVSISGWETPEPKR
jgi:hypothetical protein